ncbi:splicing factor U2af large subunit B-like isoform X6 [Pistacia vera]|uniref:splicing factor U2af large subunit B-like isoform X6 n=1 Tax=Pistacia vera TaxID=55513 RepID=UPI00126348DC|nr:splicing factor U2af large subunit B-like isoform X6 [Pistacia vera]
MTEEGIRMMIMTVNGVVIMTDTVTMIETKKRGIGIDHAPVQRKHQGSDLDHPLGPVLLQKGGEVVLIWHHLLLLCCLLLLFQKAMLGNMSHCATHGRDYCRFCVQRRTNASISWILFAFNRQQLSFGQLPGAPQTTAGTVQNMLPFGTQLGALPLMPIQAMTQQATRHARRVYVGGLPPLANEQTIATFFSQVMAAIGGNSAGPGDAVVNVYINHEKKFAFVEMRTVEEASNAMALDGIIFEGVAVRVRRPTDYNPTLAAALGPGQPSPHLNLAAVGLAPGAIGGAEGPDRVFVGGLPYYFTEAQIRELLESFGTLRGFDLVKDRDTGNSKGYGFCVYQDPTVTDIACAALNGLKMGDKTLTVRRATASSGQSKSEQDNILAQAQQHIAIQKMALQTGVMNLPGGGIAPSAFGESPAKVLCLTEAITADVLADDEEYEEVLEDMREECSKYGTLVNVVIPRPDPNGEQFPGVGKVFLEYYDIAGCATAKTALNGRKFGGNLVKAYYYPEDKYFNRDYSA